MPFSSEAGRLTSGRFALGMLTTRLYPGVYADKGYA